MPKWCEDDSLAYCFGIFNEIYSLLRKNVNKDDAVWL